MALLRHLKYSSTHANSARHQASKFCSDVLPASNKENVSIIDDFIWWNRA